MYVHMRAVPMEARKEHQISLDQSTDGFWVAMWMMRIKPYSLEEQPVLLTSRASSSDQMIIFKQNI